MPPGPSAGTWAFCQSPADATRLRRVLRHAGQHAVHQADELRRFAESPDPQPMAIEFPRPTPTPGRSSSPRTSASPSFFLPFNTATYRPKRRKYRSVPADHRRVAESLRGHAVGSGRRRRSCSALARPAWEGTLIFFLSDNGGPMTNGPKRRQSPFAARATRGTAVSRAIPRAMVAGCQRAGL